MWCSCISEFNCRCIVWLLLNYRDRFTKFDGNRPRLSNVTVALVYNAEFDFPWQPNWTNLAWVSNFSNFPNAGTIHYYMKKDRDESVWNRTKSTTSPGSHRAPVRFNTVMFHSPLLEFPAWANVMKIWRGMFTSCLPPSSWVIDQWSHARRKWTRLHCVKLRSARQMGKRGRKQTKEIRIENGRLLWYLFKKHNTTLPKLPWKLPIFSWCLTSFDVIKIQPIGW